MNRSDMGKQISNPGGLKKIPAGNKGLGKLPTQVRNKMGFMKKGGMVEKYSNGGLIGGKIKARGAGCAKKGFSFKAS
jgi:hypothetical protein